jgi:hypothetical protein
MSAPNIVNISTMYGSTAVQNVLTSAQSLVSNPAGSNTVVRVNNLIFSNINTTTNIASYVDIFRTAVAYPVSFNVSVPLNSSLVVIGKDTAIYLQEGDALRVYGGVTGSLVAVCSYETIS